MAFTAINKSTDHFNTVQWAGNGSAGRNITGVGFQPDWVWIKNKSRSSNHTLVDVLRGSGSYPLSSTQTSAQDSGDTNQVSALISDGITIGSSTNTNASSENLVGWFWKAGGAGSANTDGSTSSTVSANTTAGFSIVNYTNPSSGAPFTVGHGLGVAPKMIITKKLNGAQTWGVWHHSIGFGKYVRLDSTAAEASANLVTATSATTFSTYKDHHDTGDNIIAYCFADKTGFSKFGFYRGNGNSDGPFVFTGFRPAFIMVKGYESGGSDNWNIIDSKRLGYNRANYKLFANSNAAENTTVIADILSNGFKIRVSSSDVNHNTNNFLYMAFAEVPLVGSNNIPSLAR